MKKLILTLVLVATVSFTYAQQKSAEQRATANTKEMVKALSLDADQETEINKINLVKNTKLIANDVKEQSKEEKKANQKVIYVEAGGKFKELLGKEKMNEWWAYQKAKREKEKN